MRRFYSTTESEVRLKNYAVYYNENDDYCFPNYSVLDQKNIFLRRLQQRQKIKRQ